MSLSIALFDLSSQSEHHDRHTYCEEQWISPDVVNHLHRTSHHAWVTHQGKFHQHSLPLPKLVPIFPPTSRKNRSARVSRHEQVRS